MKSKLKFLKFNLFSKNLSNYELIQVHKLEKELKGNEIIILRAFMPKEIYETDGVNIEFLYNTNDEKIGNYFGEID